MQLINEKLNQISAKYQDSLDPLKSKTSIAKDINALADEIDSILKNTKINGSNLLAQADGTELAGNAVFGVGGDVTMDFASSSYLKVDDLNAVLNGGPVVEPGVTSFDGTSLDRTIVLSGPEILFPTLTITYSDGNYEQTVISTSYDGDNIGAWNPPLAAWINDNTDNVSASYISDGGNFEHLHFDALNGKRITSITTSIDQGIDFADVLGFKMEASGGSGGGGLRDSDADTVLAAASNLTAVTNNVKAALGRIGNLSQTLESRNEFLTSSIANNTALISKIFDADMAMEQLNATKGSIGGQIGVNMLSQVNAAPQQLLSLFR